MSHESFRSKIFFFPFCFVFFFSLKFYIFWGEGAQLKRQRVDTKGLEMDGIKMRDVKDTENK